jgi:thiamine-monophosphate kinase
MEESSSRLRAFGENRMVSRFRALAEAALTPGVILGPGDDTAILRVPPDRVLLFTCDMLAEGVHFRRDWATPWQIGWKAMAVNLSDLAAMGGEPGFAVASVSMPGEAEKTVAEELAAGMIAAASEYGAALVGGDLVGSTGPMAVDVAALGWVEEGLALRRSGARAGDAVVVTGTLGASATGLQALLHGLQEEDDLSVKEALAAHLTPRPRVKEGRAIAMTRQATAMMDISDGVAMDLPRLCAESGLGARVWEARLPLAPACAALAARLSQEAVSLALTGGEDYELLFTCPPEAVSRIADALSQVDGAGVTVIGEMTESRAIISADAEGREHGLGRGFDHFAS